MRSAPHEVTLTFTQNLEPAFSSVQVTDSSGARVDQGKAQISGNTMRIGLKALKPGPTGSAGMRSRSIPTQRREVSTFTVGGP